MTICASVKVRDGLVLGTDSMTQIWATDQNGNRGPIKTYSNARKLFQIKDLPIGVMTYGIGNLGQRSIQGVLREFSETYNGADDIKAVSENAFAFLNKEYQTAVGSKPGPGDVLGIYIAGYSPREPFPEEWEFLLPMDTTIKTVRAPVNFGASWRGIDSPFTRLYAGYDPRMITELEKMGVQPDAITKVKQFVSPMIFDGMPLQDAVDFAIFILDTTIGMSKFELGWPVCGGSLQLASVLPETGFQWIKESKLTM